MQTRTSGSRCRSKTGIDLHTVVIEWDEMRDLQVAFLRAGVFNQDFPQDHAFFTTLVRTANKYRIRSFLSGVNFSSENVEVPAGRRWIGICNDLPASRR